MTLSRPSNVPGPEIDQLVEPGKRARADRKHEHPKKPAVFRVDAPCDRNERLAPHPAENGLSDEQAVIVPIEVDSEILAIGEINRFRIRLDRARHHLSIRTDKSRLHRSPGQRGLARPAVQIEVPVRVADVRRHEVPGADHVVQDPCRFCREGESEVSAFGLRAVHRRLSRGKDRLGRQRPHEQQYHPAENDDRGGNGICAAAGLCRGVRQDRLRGDFHRYRLNSVQNS
jgi:hypothetical protein